MGFIAPRLPDVELAGWSRLPHHRRLAVLARDRALHGRTTPGAVYLLYLAKLAGYAGGAVLIVAAGSNVGGLGQLGSWWSSPIAFQKIVVWTLLWELLGLGAGSFQLAGRFRPLIGGPLYWLQPETMRLPPWPHRVPLTAGTRRQAWDVTLYAVALGSAVVLLGAGTTHGVAYDTLPGWPIWTLLLALGALGLRDRTPWLAAHPERYGVLLVVFLFAPHDLVFGAKLGLLAIWWGTAAAALNRHLASRVAVFASGAPWLRGPRARRALWRDPDRDLRPSRLAAGLGYGGVLAGFGVPLVLILSRGGWLGTVAVSIMVGWSLLRVACFAADTALEGSLFLGYATLVLFGHYAAVGASGLTSPLLWALLVLLLAGLPLLGARRGGVETAGSLWLFRTDGAEERLDSCLVKPAPVLARQLARVYDRPTAELLLDGGLAARALQLHGRALQGLLGYAVGDLTRYRVRDGEDVAGVALGWSLGDPRLPGRALLEAIQFECEFSPGELRVVTVAGRGTPHYQLLDAADGLLETGTVGPADLARRQPWTASVPVRVGYQAGHGAPPGPRRASWPRWPRWRRELRGTGGAPPARVA